MYYNVSDAVLGLITLCPLSLLYTGKIGNFTGNEFWVQELMSLVQGTLALYLGWMRLNQVYGTLKSIAIPSWFGFQAESFCGFPGIYLLPQSLKYWHYRCASHCQLTFLYHYAILSSRISICKVNNSFKWYYFVGTAIFISNNTIDYVLPIFQCT